MQTAVNSINNVRGLKTAFPQNVERGDVFFVQPCFLTSRENQADGAKYKLTNYKAREAFNTDIKHVPCMCRPQG